MKKQKKRKQSRLRLLDKVMITIALITLLINLAQLVITITQI